MATPFDKYIPGIGEQRKRFKEVFGKEVSEKIEKKEEEFRRSRSSGSGFKTVSSGTSSSPSPTSSSTPSQSQSTSSSQQQKETLAEGLKRQQEAEKIRRAELEKQRVITSLRRLEKGKIDRFTYQTVEGSKTVSDREEAKQIRSYLTGDYEKPKQIKEPKEPKDFLSFAESKLGEVFLKGQEEIERKSQEVFLAGEVQPAKTFKERFKEKPVTTTGSYLFHELPEKIIRKSEQKGILKQTPGRTYSSASLEFLPKATDVGSYFIPYVGETRLIGSGVESYATKKGRADLKVTADVLKQEKNIPKFATYTLPVAQVGLGVVGLKYRGQARTVKQEMKEFEKAGTTVIGKRYETPQGGYDILKAQKQTKEATYFAELKQPFVKGKEGEVRFVKGSGFAQRIPKPSSKLQQRPFTIYEASGYARKMESLPKKTKGMSSIELKNTEGFIGEARFKEVLKGTAKPTRLQTFPTPKQSFYIDATTKDLEKMTSRYLGVSKSKKGYLMTQAGEISKARIGTVEGETKLLAEPKINSIIKRVKPPKNVKYIEKIKQERSVPPGSPQSQQQVSKTVYKPTLAPPPPVSATLEFIKPQELSKAPSYVIGTTGVGARTTTSKYYGVSSPTDTEYIKTSVPSLSKGLTKYTPISIPKTSMVNLSKTMPTFKTVSKTRGIQKEKLKPKTLLKEKTILREESLLRNLQREKLLTKQATKQRTRLLTKEMTKLITTPPPPRLELTPPLLSFPFLFKSKKKKRKGKDYFQDSLKDDLAFSEGFTSRFLKLGTREIKLKDALKMKEIPLGIRKAPIIK